jgi:rhamnogalacturonyl hydrolase YesR
MDRYAGGRFRHRRGRADRQRARAVNQGWIDPAYAGYSHSGWKELLTKLDSQLKIRDVRPGTDMSGNVRYCLDRPRRAGELHGIGPFLLAVLEVLKLERRKDRR